jgi:hypothetical protein
MVLRINQENRVNEAVKTASNVPWLRPCASLKRRIKERKIFAVRPTFVSANSASLADENVGVTKNLPRVFFEEKTRGEPTKTKPTKENRKGAHAAI